ncbi:hypothetical protein Tco_0442834 [Tanacetum coccineum]
MVKPKIGGNVDVEIKSQFIQELREDTFSGNKKDDAHEHVERVLDIVSLFNIPGVSYDAEPLILGISLKRPLSKGIVHHQGLPNSLKKFATSSRKEMRLYTKLGSGFSDNEKQETDNSRMAEALAALEATLKIKKKNLKKKNKDLVENKPRTEEDVEGNRKNLGATLFSRNHLPPMEQDPGSFILPCSIGKLDFNNALADLGASINVMPLSMYKRPQDDLKKEGCIGVRRFCKKKKKWERYVSFYDPNHDVCDGIDSPIIKVKRYWESMNDSQREELEWENLSINDWMKIRLGRFGDEEDDLG